MSSIVVLRIPAATKRRAAAARRSSRRSRRPLDAAVRRSSVTCASSSTVVLRTGGRRFVPPAPRSDVLPTPSGRRAPRPPVHSRGWERRDTLASKPLGIAAARYSATASSPQPATTGRIGVSVSLFADRLTDRESWQDDANCKGVDIDIFFSLDETDQKQALELCKACPVQRECLRDAIEQREMYGIWG
ncbi:MAG: WhiB family transcriptional regulator, partial [Actinobacteria bacterium]|nr:WhiB family transcriptional regulator [Actinomycetota bacterium]